MEYIDLRFGTSISGYNKYGYIITTDNSYQSKLTDSMGLINKGCGNIKSAYIPACNRKNPVP